MRHHVSVGTNDLPRVRAFYDAVLPAVGLHRIKDDEASAHYGAATLIFSAIEPIDGAPATVGHGAHVAFAVEDRSAVDAFHRAALAHGGQDDGAPGVRPIHDDHYYAAFVRDPDGNKIEAVTFASR